MALIVLATDFGTKDGHVGVMKGVILRIAPMCQIIDLTHEIRPQNISEAALILRRSYRYFPTETIFIVVVDPGVGTTRRPLAAQIGDYRFVLPDNGIITPILTEAQDDSRPITLINLTQPRFWNEKVSSVFHGRDIFAPAGAYLATGVEITDLGDPIQDPVLNFPSQPTIYQDKIAGEIIHIDHFGNISTNIQIDHLGNTKHIRLIYKNFEILGLYRTFGDAESGSLIAFIGSTGSLLIGKVNGDAAAFLSAKYGDPIEVIKLDQ